jgi:hypothetical protein
MSMSNPPVEPINHLELRREASKLLHQRGRLALAEQWGEVFVGGSYSIEPKSEELGGV